LSKLDVVIAKKTSKYYEVAKILAVRSIDGNKQYRVRWKGFGSKNKTKKTKHLNSVIDFKKWHLFLSLSFDFRRLLRTRQTKKRIVVRSDRFFSLLIELEVIHFSMKVDVSPR